jgi:YVTN family beta-propeller protein
MQAAWKGRGVLSTTVAIVVVAAAVLGAFALVTTIPGAAASPNSGRLAGSAPGPCATGTNPDLPAYDPADDYIYVPNSGSHNVSVFSGTCRLVGTVKLPSKAEPSAAAFDPTDNLVYVTDLNLDHVYEISGTKLSATATCTCLDAGDAITFDPALGSMIVANYVSDSIVAVAGSSFSGTVPVGSLPDAIAYNPVSGDLIVANSGSDNISAIDASSLANIGGLAVGKEPQGVAYDPATGYVYVTNLNSKDVTVIYNGAVLTTLGGFDRPSGIVWDQKSLKLYVSNIGNGKIYTINVNDVVSKKLVTAAGAQPFGITYDESTHDVFVAGFSDDELYVLT